MEALYPTDARARAGTGAAWDAAGVAVTTPPPTCNVDAAAVPFESAHPYAKHQTCTWTDDAAGGGFRFRFSQLDVETNYDFVELLDANGAVLQRITGRKSAGYLSVRVPSAIGKVRLRTDGSVTRQGFRVDAIVR